MKTIQEVEAWCEGAAIEYGDPSIPVCQLFMRYVEGDHRPDRKCVFDLFCFRDGDDYVLFLGPEPDLIVPIPIAREKVVDEQGVRCYGADRIASGVWALTPSLNIPGVIHGFVVLYDVPNIPLGNVWCFCPTRLALEMESSEIFAVFSGTKCAGCGGTKRRMNAFCKWCYAELPKALQNALWQRFGSGFEQAYMGCLSWFRTHPLQGVHRAKQQGLFEEKS